VAKQAVDIEHLLVWAFRTEQVEHAVSEFRRGAVGPSGSLGCSIEQVLTLGTRVDSSGAGANFLAARCADDALTVYEAVMALPPEAWMLAIKHARSDTVPEWYPEGPGRYVVPLDRAGQPKRLWRDPDRRRGDMGPAPAELVGLPPALVEDARASYRLWHVTLCELVPLLNPELERFTATMPAAPAEPWNLEISRVQALIRRAG
jgi:hypothetical protein